MTQIAGGDSYNVTPDAVRMAGTIRALSPETMALGKRRVHEIADGVAQAHRCEAAVSWREHVRIEYPPTINDAGMAALVQETAVRCALNPF